MEPKIETSISIKNGKMYETQSKNGKPIRIAVFEDLNHDGKYSANEVTTVYKYEYKNGGNYKETMYLDNNNDGTLDVIRLQDYNQNGQKLGATTWKEIIDKCCDFHSNMQNIRDSHGLSVFHLPSWEIE